MKNKDNLDILIKLLRIGFINEAILNLVTDKNEEQIAHVSKSNGFISLSNENYFIAIAQKNSDLKIINDKLDFIFNRQKIIVFLENQYLDYKSISLNDIETECMKNKAVSINNIFLYKLRETFNKITCA